MADRATQEKRERQLATSGLPDKSQSKVIRSSHELKSAVFLDRDGVICRERADYVKSVEEFEFLPGALDAVRILTSLRLPIVVITNQSLVGRGIVSDAKLRQIHRHMVSAISRHGGEITGVLYCPHRPTDGCGCRKPKPGLFDKASKRFGILVQGSWFIGNQLTDEEAGKSVGCRTVIIPTNSPTAFLEAAKFVASHYDTRYDSYISAASRIEDLKTRDNSGKGPA